MKEWESILAETSVFVDKIKNTEVFKEYRSAAQELEKCPELKAMADRFREEQYRVFNDLKEPAGFTVLEALENQRMNLLSYPEIERYLRTETAVCRVFQHIQDMLAESACLETDKEAL